MFARILGYVTDDMVVTNTRWKGKNYKLFILSPITFVSTRATTFMFVT